MPNGPDDDGYSSGSDIDALTIASVRDNHEKVDTVEGKEGQEGESGKTEGQEEEGGKGEGEEVNGEKGSGDRRKDEPQESGEDTLEEGHPGVGIKSQGEVSVQAPSLEDDADDKGDVLNQNDD